MADTGVGCSQTCIDITGDEPVEVRFAKRQRFEDSPPSLQGDGLVSISVAEPRYAKCDPADLGDHEDLKIVGDTGGQAALKDLPHARNQCGNFPFVSSHASLVNGSACDQCFCFVCDMKAADCCMWGTGESANDHCNAHQSTHWQALRSKRRRGDMNGILAAYVGVVQPGQQQQHHHQSQPSLQSGRSSGGPLRQARLTELLAPKSGSANRSVPRAAIQVGGVTVPLAGQAPLRSLGASPAEGPSTTGTPAASTSQAVASAGVVVKQERLSAPPPAGCSDRIGGAETTTGVRAATPAMMQHGGNSVGAAVSAADTPPHTVTPPAVVGALPAPLGAPCSPSSLPRQGTQSHDATESVAFGRAMQGTPNALGRPTHPVASSGAVQATPAATLPAPSLTDLSVLVVAEPQAAVSISHVTDTAVDLPDDADVGSLAGHHGAAMADVAPGVMTDVHADAAVASGTKADGDQLGPSRDNTTTHVAGAPALISRGASDMHSPEDPMAIDDAAMPGLSTDQQVPPCARGASDARPSEDLMEIDHRTDAASGKPSTHQHEPPREGAEAASSLTHAAGQAAATEAEVAAVTKRLLAQAAATNARVKVEVAAAVKTAAKHAAAAAPCADKSRLALTPRPLPDPSRNDALMFLGTITLPVKARRGHTIAQLAGRLAPHGLYQLRQTAAVELEGPSDDDPLSIESLFEVKPVMRGGRMVGNKQKPVRLSVVPPVDSAMSATSRLRVRQVTVVDCQGRWAPTVMGVRVHVSVKLPQAAAALTAVLQPPLAADEELVWIQQNKVVKDDFVLLGSKDCKVKNIFEGHKRFNTFAFRMPIAAAAAASKATVIANEPSSSGLDAAAVAVAAAAVTAGRDHDEAAAGGSGEREQGEPAAGVWGKLGRDEPAAALGVKAEAPPSALPSAAQPEAQYVLVRHLIKDRGPHHPTFRDTAPVLIRMTPELKCATGQAADNIITQAVMAAMQFARPAVVRFDTMGSEAGAAANEQVAGSVTAGGASNQAGSASESVDSASAPASEPAAAASKPTAASAPVAAGAQKQEPAFCLHIESQGWREVLLSEAATFEVNSLTLRKVSALWSEAAAAEAASGLKSVVDQSAAPEALAENDALDAAAKDALAAHEASSARLAAAVEQLGTNSSTPLSAHKVASCNLPSVAVTTSLDCGPEAVAQARAALKEKWALETAAGNEAASMSRDATRRHGRRNVKASRLGLVTFKVYAWREFGKENQTLFRPHDEVASWHTMVPTTGAHRFGEVFLLLGRDAPNARLILPAYRQSSQAVDTRFVSPLSIEAVMEHMVSGERPAAPQPEGLSVTLRPYQLQSLQFMMDVEAAPGGFRSLFWLDIKTPTGQQYWFSPALNRASLYVPNMSTGGFLAETMGLGKTVEVLALILAMPAPRSIVSGSRYSHGKVHSRATLVLCAVSLVGQWCDEAASKNKGAIRMHQYYGTNRCRDARKLATDFDLVVSTYETVASDFSRAQRGKEDTCPLAGIHWHRIVLDEGHKLREVKTKASQAVLTLSSGRRWMCTGTPINTKVEDLCPEFAAIQCPVMADRAFLNRNSLGLPSTKVALLYAMRTMFIRHTHEQRLGGEDVLSLPPKTDEVVHVRLSPAEQSAYMRVHQEVRSKWDAIRAQGAAFVNRNLLVVQAMVLPLRRICSGGFLQEWDLHVPELGRADGDMQDAAPATARLDTNALETTLLPDNGDCSICLEPRDRPVMTPCRHWFCKECISSVLTTTNACPLCRSTIHEGELRAPHAAGPAAAAIEADGAAAGTSAGGTTAEEAGTSGGERGDGGGRGGGVLAESKLRVLLAELKEMHRTDPTSKALIFTQFSATMDWLRARLTQEGIGYRCVTGVMPAKQRAAAIDAFLKDPPTTVFLLSMRSGAVGINLTSASHVFLLEPCLNPALEAQAIGRAWRMGQKRPVTVKRLCVQGSVEESIMELVKKRQTGHDSGTETSLPSRYVGRAESLAHAGALKADKQLLRIDELVMLFSTPRFGDEAVPMLTTTTATEVAL